MQIEEFIQKIISLEISRCSYLMTYLLVVRYTMNFWKQKREVFKTEFFKEWEILQYTKNLSFLTKGKIAS